MSLKHEALSSNLSDQLVNVHQTLACVLGVFRRCLQKFSEADERGGRRQVDGGPTDLPLR